MSKEKLTVNYPFEKNSIFLPVFLSNTEIIADYPDLRIIKSDYDNGFKVIFIETDHYYIVKTNWELDYVKDGVYLPKIQ